MEKSIYWSSKVLHLNKHKSADFGRDRYKCLVCFEELHGKLSSFYFLFRDVKVYETESSFTSLKNCA